MAKVNGECRRLEKKLDGQIRRYPAQCTAEQVQGGPLSDRCERLYNALEKTMNWWHDSGCSQSWR